MHGKSLHVPHHLHMLAARSSDRGVATNKTGPQLCYWPSLSLPYINARAGPPSCRLCVGVLTAQLPGRRLGRLDEHFVWDLAKGKEGTCDARYAFPEPLRRRR